ncbi:hypothetical protein [Marinobacter sp. C2H3]|uniref:hypothetical protein n=1 Tax=Marinobacter sp. C2H3 TaxID=3119003 RepID=UPI00300E7036
MSKLQNLYFSLPVSLQEIAVSLYGRRLYKQRYSGIYTQLLEEIFIANDWSDSQKETYQSEKLHEIIKHCFNHVPYYQRIFAEYGFSASDFTSLNDISKLPILDKKSIIKNPDDFINRNERPFIKQNTSGSTGTPLSIYLNEKTYKLAMALLVHHEECHGVKFGEPRATFAGRMVLPATSKNPPFSRFNRAENQRLFSSYHLSQATLRQYDRELADFSPYEIIGYPSAISLLANLYIESNISPSFKPKLVVTNSETLHMNQRAAIEKAFDCPVRDYYGSAEYVMFASQKDDMKYHFNHQIGITEAIPNGDGTAELLATSLTNTVMPLLRYRIGDQIHLDESATSASVVKSADSIAGRTDDYVILPDGRKIGRLDHIFKGLTGIIEAQLIQENERKCTIALVSEKLSEQNERILRKNFEERVGPELILTFQYVDRIPKGKNGKFKSVVRKI